MISIVASLTWSEPRSQPASRRHKPMSKNASAPRRWLRSTGAKTVFFSNVSHEFRTPLSLIIGPLSDAQKRKQGLDVEQLDLVHRNSLRLLKLGRELIKGEATAVS